MIQISGQNKIKIESKEFCASRGCGSVDDILGTNEMLVLSARLWNLTGRAINGLSEGLCVGTNCPPEGPALYELAIDRGLIILGVSVLKLRETQDELRGELMPPHDCDNALEMLPLNDEFNEELRLLLLLYISRVEMSSGLDESVDVLERTRIRIFFTTIRDLTSGRLFRGHDIQKQSIHSQVFGIYCAESEELFESKDLNEDSNEIASSITLSRFGSNGCV
ncbi:unnamed protein product [Medioppia subpectinata]|uniref:Uncharacterized protein n=1 Tax=Medioppia subpectinata TaxID=1979941 RepID=A0A7R9KS63_9ACAR|nr:unnamed protein product [Medioppia subpectinata]CAG2107466.1 unnamed protein product [Medioppia subpectinata]